MEKAMMNLLVGSRAMNYWTGEPQSPDSDYDIIGDLEFTSPNDRIEVHSPDLLNNHEFFQFASNDMIAIDGKLVHVCNPRGLAIMKRSHLWRNLKFDRHITHYHRKLKPLVGEFTEEENQLLNRRIQMTMKEFPQRHPSLKKTVSEFFDDYVTKKYDHDYLHRLVAFNGEPMYRKMQRDHSMAWCDKLLWDDFSDLEKQQCVAEEAFVISIERFLVPTEWDHNPKSAYIKSLNMVCTTLCSGWFRDYAIDNYPAIHSLFSARKLQEIRETLTKEI